MNEDKAVVVKKSPLGRRRLILIAVAVLLLCLIGIAIGFMLWRTSPKTVVLESVQHTIAPPKEQQQSQQQMKFHATMDVPAVDGVAAQNLTVDGAYKLGDGLSATAVASTTNFGVKVSKTSNWVIDKAGALYTHLDAYTAEVVGKSDLTPDNLKLMNMATQAITKKNKDVWLKTTASDLGDSNAYGLQACTLVTFFKVQSGDVPLQNLLSKFINSSDFAFNSTAPDTYTITAKAGHESAVEKLYTASDLYKTLTKCDATRYTATSKSVADTLKKLTVTLKLDAASKTISSVSVAVKDSFTLAATLTPTKDVTITVPKVTEPPKGTVSGSTQDYLQQNAYYLYKNLMIMQNNIQNPPTAKEEQ